jgi:Protein of unknown function (DUF1579)
MSTQATTSEYRRSLAQGDHLEPCHSQEFPKPGPEHDWLQQFVGEWETDVECSAEPGEPPMKSKGTESVRPIGEFWIIAESKSTVMEKPMTSVLTLGYDPEKKKYIGTWVGSCNNYLWGYLGAANAAAKILTLETEDPCPMAAPGTLAKFKEVIEVKSKDHRVFTSSMRREDGKWATIATINYRRKK